MLLIVGGMRWALRGLQSPPLGLIIPWSQVRILPGPPSQSTACGKATPCRPGLCDSGATVATISRRKKGWQARIRREGWPQITRTFRTKGEAERWARDQERRMDAGQWQDQRHSQRTTVAEAIERYISEVSVYHKGAKREADRMRWWARELGEYALANVTPADVADVRDRRLETVSTTTVRNDLATLSPLFTHARKEWSHPIENPVQAIRWPSPSRHRDRRLDPDEEQALRDSARSPYHTAYLTIALETGMRRGEILAMRWEHVDLGSRVVRLPETKNGEARDVPLSPAAAEALQSIPRQISGKVWPWNSEGAASMWTRWLRRAGVEDLRFHDLRHEATSRLVESGQFSLTEVAAITGHRTMQMLKRYANHRATDLARRMENT